MLKQGKDFYFNRYKRKYLHIVTNYSLQKFRNTVGKEITFVKMTMVLKPMKYTANRLINKMLFIIP